MRLLNTHSHTSERPGYEARKNAKKSKCRKRSHDDKANHPSKTCRVPPVWRGGETKKALWQDRPPRKDRGVDSMGSDTTLQNVGEIRAKLQNGEAHMPNDATFVRWQSGDTEYPLAGLPTMLVLGDYSLGASDDVGEKQLYYSQSRDGIWRCGALARLILWLSRIRNAILIIRKQANYLFLG